MVVGTCIRREDGHMILISVQKTHRWSDEQDLWQTRGNFELFVSCFWYRALLFDH